MKLPLRSALTLAPVLLLAASSAAMAFNNRFERTLNVSAQADLYVSTSAGDITIHPGSDNQIHIVGHVHSGLNLLSSLQGRIQEIVQNPPITQNGNSVRVGDSNGHERYNNLRIDYDISAPASVALNLRSGSGDILVDHVGRFLAAASGSGDVRAHGVKGPTQLATGSGDIALDEDGVGDIQARSGSGNIQIHGFHGGLNLRSGSGDILADGRLTGSAELHSGSGDIKLHLTPDAHFNLEAATGSGDIDVNFPGASRWNDRSRQHLTTAINGGGPVLQARTGSGNIEINQQ
ncbi:MAG: DUF4097 family beta strand repeat-containing protein [Acidobacteriaceae bacterium]